MYMLFLPLNLAADHILMIIECFMGAMVLFDCCDRVFFFFFFCLLASHPLICFHHRQEARPRSFSSPAERRLPDCCAGSTPALTAWRFQLGDEFFMDD